MVTKQLNPDRSVYYTRHRLIQRHFYNIYNPLYKA